jgi:hypothetical protein
VSFLKGVLPFFIPVFFLIWPVLVARIGFLVFGFWFLLVCDAGWFAVRLRWHPRFASGSQALPLCGAAPTFLCRRKEK